MPVKRPAKRLPSASQLSSTSHRPWRSQNAFTAFTSKGLPSVWASITAFVRGERAASSCETSTLTVSSSMSTNTGTAPNWTIGAIVVGKPAATVITSSPRQIRRSPRSGDVSVMNARRFADEPEFTKSANRTPR